MKHLKVLQNWYDWHKGNCALHHSSQARWLALDKLLKEVIEMQVERDIAHRMTTRPYFPGTRRSAPLSKKDIRMGSRHVKRLQAIEVRKIAG